MKNQADAIVSLLYEATLDPSAWSGALDLLAESLHAVGASYFVWDAERQCANFWCAVGHSESMQQKYLAHYSTLDPTRDVAMNGKVGEIFFSRLLFPDRYIQKSEYFQDYLIPAGIGNVLGGKIMESNASAGIFSVQQSAGAQGLAEKDQSLIVAITPHLMRAAKIHWRMAALHKQALSLQVALTAISLPVLLVDSQQRLHFMNGAAERLLASGKGLLIRSQRLSCSDLDSDRILTQKVTQATSNLHCESSALRVPSGTDDHLLTFVPIPEVQSAGLHSGRLALVVAFPDPPPTEEFSRLIAGVFHLTPAEKKLACRLLAGGSLSEIADESQLGRETIRSQLRSIFEKTGTNRQAQLVMLLQQLAFITPSQL